MPAFSGISISKRPRRRENRRQTHPACRHRISNEQVPLTRPYPNYSTVKSRWHARSARKCSGNDEQWWTWWWWHVSRTVRPAQMGGRSVPLNMYKVNGIVHDSFTTTIVYINYLGLNAVGTNRDRTLSFSFSFVSRRLPTARGEPSFLSLTHQNIFEVIFSLLQRTWKKVVHQLRNYSTTNTSNALLRRQNKLH